MPDPDESQPTLFRKKCKRYNTPGHAHFLTFSCFQRRPFLAKDRSRGWLIDAINSARDKHHFDLWAYVIMPEHAHIVLFPTIDPYDISAIFKSIKLSVANTAIAYVKRYASEFLVQMTDAQPNGNSSIRFWQRGGGYDRNLHSFEEIWEKIDYIHNNPVKRELCGRADDWNWSSAADYSGLRKGPIELNLDQLPRH